MSTDGFPEVLIWSNGTERYRSGAWNGKQLGGVPEMKSSSNTSIMEFEFLDTSDEISYSFEMLNSSVYSRLVISSSCFLKRFTWINTTQTWSMSSFAPRDQCDYYKQCGPYGICDTNYYPVCKCMKGFVPKIQQAWDLGDGSDGCVRSSKLDCGSDGFLKLKNMKLPDSSKVFVDQTMNLTTCGAICKRNCSCAAYANMDVTKGGSGCVMWEVDLIDMRQYADSEGGGQELYIRVSASDLVPSSTTTRASGKGSGNHLVMIVAITAGVSTVIIVMVIILLLVRWKKMQLLKNSRIDRKVKKCSVQDFLMKEGNNVPSKSGSFEIDLPLFDFTTLVMATKDFSNENKLGHGGFGPVYKGVLANGEVVAIKRLSRTSDQGIEELRNEFIFDKEKGAQLNWEKRFDIISGIARGLLYLHQDSRLRIIHRDLKTSNVLLDKEMNPKISDFGLARIFGSNQTEAETKKVVGTCGYIAPEYAMDGLFSIKSDVFSFGVLLLEIVSGKRNRGFYFADNQLNLLGHTWKLWSEGNCLELLDESVGAEFSRDEVLRCIHIGLLCVQEQAEQRPNMAKVLLMLSSDVGQLPQPRHPGFNIGLRSSEVKFPINHDESASVNQVTITILDGRFTPGYPFFTHSYTNPYQVVSELRNLEMSAPRRDRLHQHRRFAAGGNGNDERDPRDVEIERLHERIFSTSAGASDRKRNMGDGPTVVDRWSVASMATLQFMRMDCGPQDQMGRKDYEGPTTTSLDVLKSLSSKIATTKCVGAELFERFNLIANNDRFNAPYDPGGTGLVPGETTREVKLFRRVMVTIINGSRVDVPFDPGDFAPKAKLEDEFFRRGGE
ncbi:receptor-like serine/threonine-protein kinase SD1-8 [Tanacetum coccineum]|uniref:Receptor-like serine/threonine-protein kinase SD1-8 n=1 Tax=Tanacetum coccineum TaxID=301880 RepID=A0ABQ4WH69_9ASTR